MPAADGCGLYETDIQLKVLAEREHELRQDSKRDELLSWTRTLEMSLVFASAHEAIVRLGLKTCADVVRHVEEIDRLVATLSRLDPANVFAENEAFLAPYRRLIPPAHAPAVGSTQDVVRAVQSLLLFLPEERLAAARTAEPQLAHRCRLSWEGLRSFVSRHTHPNSSVMAVAGHAYAEGRLTVDEVAAVLGATVPDAVALLEDHGFRRAVDELVLSDDERRARLRALADDRARRGARPVVDEGWIEREVIASQRIEDIDARPWPRR